VDVSTVALLVVRSDADEFYVTVDLDAEEHGDEGLGRVEQHHERTIPRRLA
jgi:hypothetical protein